MRAKNREKGGDPQDDDPEPIADYINGLLDAGRGGPLHKIEWYRVVLDESHLIKNQLSRGSFAVNALRSKFRWCFSGTPIMNRPEEYYAYLSFLKALPVLTYRQFQSEYCISDEGKAKLKKFNQNLILRRTIGSKLLGRFLVTLPKATEYVACIEFTALSRVLYDAVIRRFLELRRLKFHKDEKPKDPLVKFKSRFHQLTRLRQLSFDVLLIPLDLKILFTNDRFEGIAKEMKEVLGDSSKDYIFKELKCLQQEKKAEQKKRDKQRATGLLNSDDESSDEEEDEDFVICPVCQDDVEEPRTIKGNNCKDIFCRQCIEEYSMGVIQKGLEYLACPGCRLPFDVEDIVAVQASKKKKIVTKAKELPYKPKKGVDYLGHRAKPQIKQASAWDWIKKHDLKKGKVPRSPKLKATYEELKGHPDDKKIVFVQFIQEGIAIGTMLQEEGHKFLYYDGSMRPKQRKRAVELMQNNSDIKILICGLKCGSVGLNWTWANHVIITDPWWNKSVESQAFSRTYRIGQMKETTLTKLPVKNSIDDWLLRMQKNKLAMIDRTNVNVLTSEELDEYFCSNQSDGEAQDAEVDDEDVDEDLFDENTL